MPCEPLKIRQASMQDIELILENESACYEIPWSQKSIEACFSDDYQFWVMLDQTQQQLIGHMIIQSVVDEIHLHNVCVNPAYQSRGLGKYWIEHLLQVASSGQNNVIFLEVRQSNFRAINLYRQHRFEVIATRKNYYRTPDGSEHGLVMELRL